MTLIPFVDLPTEILQLICSCFCLHCRGDCVGPEQHPDEPSWYSLERHALFSLCLTSRQFYEIAQPILYHEFIPGYGRSWRSNLYSWDGRLMSFVQTMKRRRDLAALVKWIFIHPDLLKPICDEETRDARTRTVPAKALSIRAWHQASDLAATLMAQLPNLERCSFQVVGLSVETIRMSALRAAGVTSLPLKTLDISLNSTPVSAQGCLFSLDLRARPIIELSTRLETLNLHMCGDTWRHLPFAPLPNLKTLRITRSRLSDEGLRRLLSSCFRLHTFFYEATSPAINRLHGTIEDGSDHFELSSAIKYLSRYNTTLKSLHLDLRWRDWSPFIVGNHTKPASSFRDFGALEHLFLNSSELYSTFWEESPMDSHLLAQRLPLSIRSLYLAGHIGTALPRMGMGLLNLADATSQGHFPQLKQVKCDIDQKLGDEFALNSKFATAGVDFGYESWPQSEGILKPSEMFPPTPLLSTPLPSSEDSNI